MLTSETKRRIDACRDVLVGKLPLPTDQVELITLALIYKFMDDLDEESVRLGGKRSFFVNGLAQYRWRALMPQTVSAEQRMTLFAAGIEAASKAAHLPGLFRDIFRNAFLKFRDGRILSLFLAEINGFAYSHSEELGNAFEYLLQCMGTQGENGQFRTPRHIIDFMVACLDPKPTDRILDPACGTGGFLVSSFKHVLAANTSPGSSLPGDKLSHDQRQQVYRNLAGYDITDLMVKLSKVNLFLHGFPDPAIHIYDTLSNEARWHEKADLILANPPFMTPKGGVTPHAKFRIQAKKAEVLFTDYIAEHLTPEGRGGVIVPNGIVATTQRAYVQLRRFLVEDSLVAVVSLPAGVFKPYSGVKTSILFLDKALARKTDKVLFLKITADGFDLGDQRRPIEANDLPEAERVVKAWFKGKIGESTQTILAWKLVDKKTLLDSRDLSLSSERFLGEKQENGSHVPFVKLGDVLSLEYGKPLKDNDRSGSGFPVYGSNGQVGLHKDFIVSGPFIVIGRKGSAGEVTWSQENGWPIDTTFYVALKRDDLDLKFLYRVLQRAELNKLVEQAGVPGLNRNDAYEVEIPLPPLEEQRRIVAEIEGYQKIIDGARQILDAYRPILAANTECEWIPLGEVLQFMRNGANVTQLDQPSKSRVSRIQTIADGTFNPEKTKWTDDEVSEDRYLQEGDILLSHINSEAHLAKTAIFRRCTESVVHGINLLCLRPDREKIEPEYLAYWLKQDVFAAEALTYAKRAVNQASITTTDLKGIKIPLPPLDEQRQIVEELDAEAAQMEAVRALIPRFEVKIQRVLDRVWGKENK